jgi:maltooligosyltrehalose trehalohydrolase
MQQLSKKHSNVDLIADDRGLIIHRWNGDAGIFAILNFQQGVFDAEVGFPEGEWERVLDSSADRWQGQGSRSPETASGTATIDVPAFSAIIYQRTA